jgi:hypothetical protein
MQESAHFSNHIRGYVQLGFGRRREFIVYGVYAIGYWSDTIIAYRTIRHEQRAVQETVFSTRLVMDVEYARHRKKKREKKKKKKEKISWRIFSLIVKQFFFEQRFFDRSLFESKNTKTRERTVNHQST